jgi:NAD(P)-dependent dehydrogenase (short-subunit alcohol dehydrogenase family)
MAAAHPVASVSAAKWRVSTNPASSVRYSCLKLSCAPHAQCALINISAGLIYSPSIPTWSAYQSSKLAAVSLINSIGTENLELFVLNVHPGVIEGGVLEAAGGSGVVGREIWIIRGWRGVLWFGSVATKGKFLRGRLTWVN